MLPRTFLTLLLCATLIICQDTGRKNNKTTTPKPTTATPIITTEVPITTTTSAPITTELPVDVVPVYSVKNGSNICLLAQLNLKVIVPYYDKQNNAVSRYFYLNSTNYASVNYNGTCSDDTQVLQLYWKPQPKEPTWILQFIFRRDHEESPPDHFHLDRLSFNYNVTTTLFPDSNDTTSNFVYIEDSKFSCAVGSFYKCTSKQTLKLTNHTMPPSPTHQQDVFVMLSDVRMEAFRNSTESKFVGSMSECSADYIPNKVVPIVVGVVLAILIVIALLAFFIGHRRRQIGYQEI